MKKKGFKEITESELEINGVKYIFVEDENTSCSNCSIYEYCLDAKCGSNDRVDGKSGYFIEKE